MLQLKNNTPFKAAMALFPDENAIDNLFIMIKATFSIGAKVSVAETQSPIVVADEYWGEPGQSSLQFATEYHLLKPGTDIVMAGAACAPDHHPVQVLDVTLSVGRHHKTVRVFGERRWMTGIIGVDISKPAPFVTMPLVYERAFGGEDTMGNDTRPVLFEPRNPVGVGFLGRRQPKALKGTPLPNLEDPGHLIQNPGDCPEPAGFSFIAPSWEPRRRYAGTYDEAWTRKRAPYLPEDFDARFFHTAAPGLVCDTPLMGGEAVMITHMSPDGALRFNLPQITFDMGVRLDGSEIKPQVNLETVFLEPNEKRMSLSWRTSVACDKKSLKIEEIRIEQKQLMLN